MFFFKFLSDNINTNKSSDLWTYWHLLGIDLTVVGRTASGFLGSNIRRSGCGSGLIILLGGLDASGVFFILYLGKKLFVVSFSQLVLYIDCLIKKLQKSVKQV